MCENWQSSLSRAHTTTDKNRANDTSLDSVDEQLKVSAAGFVILVVFYVTHLHKQYTDISNDEHYYQCK